MSVAEKKALAVEKLKALENEVAIDEILAHLEKIANNKKIDFFQMRLQLMKFWRIWKK